MVSVCFPVFRAMDSWSCSLQELLQDEKTKEPTVRLNADSRRVQPSSFSLAMHNISDKILEEGKVEVELVEAEYTGPNCVVFSYFEGDAMTQVERHFSRSLSHLSKSAPGQKESGNDVNNEGQGEYIYAIALIPKVIVCRRVVLHSDFLSKCIDNAVSFSLN